MVICRANTDTKTIETHNKPLPDGNVQKGESFLWFYVKTKKVKLFIDYSFYYSLLFKTIMDIYIVWCNYNGVSFLKKILKKDARKVSSAQTLVYILPQLLQWYKQCPVIFDHVLTASKCICDNPSPGQYIFPSKTNMKNVISLNRKYKDYVYRKMLVQEYLKKWRIFKRVKRKNDMMYHDIYNCICQNTKK